MAPNLSLSDPPRRGRRERAGEQYGRVALTRKGSYRRCGRSAILCSSRQGAGQGIVNMARAAPTARWMGDIGSEFQVSPRRSILMMSHIESRARPRAGLGRAPVSAATSGPQAARRHPPVDATSQTRIVQPGEGPVEMPTLPLTARVPWHDSRWNGTVCCKPFCTTLDRIREEWDDAREDAIAGKPWSGLKPDELPVCKAELGAFMNDRNQELRGRTVIRPTPVNIPIYSIA